VPRNLREVRSWLGLIGYYRRWIVNFSGRARALFDLARKGVNFHWSQDQQKSFDDLKFCLTSAPVLGLPVDDGQFVLDTDCSAFAAGAVLSQQQGQDVKVIAYASRTPRGAELNYSTTRKEMTAVIFGLKQFKQYLLGRGFLLRTDHAALTSLMKTPEVVGQQARYLDFVSQFDFEIIHRPGTTHGNCDSLSRRPEGYAFPDCGRDTDGEEAECNILHTIRVVTENSAAEEMEVFYEDLFLNYDNNVDLPTNEEVPTDCDVGETDRIEAQHFITDADADVLSAENIAKKQNEDPDLSFIIDCKKRGLSPPSATELAAQSEEVGVICAQWESLVLTDGMLYRLFEDLRKNNVILQVIVPRCLRKLYVRQCHTGMTGGHQGIRKTQEQVARRAYFPAWKNTVVDVCCSCEECAKYHRGRPPRQGPLQMQEVSNVMDQLDIDLTGPHPTSSKGHVYIMTAVDVFSRFLVAVPIRNKAALTVAEALYQNVFCVFGTARRIKTDLGREFENELLSSLCSVFGIKKLRTSAYHASANGRVERSHRTRNSIIAKVISENQRNWHEVLRFAVAAYNASPNESTKFSPNFLMFGREVLTPFDIISARPIPGSLRSTDEFVAELQETMEKAYRLVRRNTHVAAQTRKRINDANVRIAEFACGKFGWVYQPRAWRKRSPKWTSYYTGPFRVERRINVVMYVVRRTPACKPMVVHVDKMKPYRGDVPKQWRGHQERNDAEPQVGQPLTDNGHSEPVVFGDSVVGSSTIATVVGRTDAESRFGGDVESRWLTAEDYEDLSVILAEFERMVPQPTATTTAQGTGWATTTADAATKTDRVVQTSIGTSTVVVSARRVGVGDTVLVDDSETIRVYGRTLELPERTSIGQQ
jgi:hypothetical protein